jgi:penicillin amidase
LLVIVAVLAATGWWWTLRVVPPLDGRIPLRGLRAPVAVRFDRFAIPHISATSDEDAWQTVGLLQARDRLWQMELYRRVASGRLSELLGEATVEIDRRFLTLGLRRAAEIEWQRTNPSVRTAFESYARGVNAAMSVGQGRLPLELQLLRVQPEPWTPIDSLAIGKLFAWRLGANHTAELLRYELAQALGDRAQELLPGPPEWAPTILGTIVDRPSAIVHRQIPRVEPASPLAEMRLLADRRSTTDDRRSTINDRRWPIDDGRSTIDDGRSTMPPGLEWLSSDARALSNSWVVSGARTATGRPLLANDPHLAIEMPSVWWEAHVTGATVNVAGVTIPGIPFVIIGHNERIGWGLTNVGADVQDFFVEQLDPSRQKYLEGDTWVPLDTTHYAIRVSGRDRPVEFDVRSTRHGPVLNAGDWHDPLPGMTVEPPAVEPLDQTVLALKWPVIEGESAAAFNALARAGNWADFIEATRQFSAPAQNFVYADVDGNIGYAMSGLLPIRSAGDGSMPTPGWLSDADWSGLIGGVQLPAQLNPSTGQIVTANNEVARNLPLNITRDWVAPFRAARIIEMLGDRRGLDIPAMARMQGDITSLAAKFLLSALGDAAPKELRAWDSQADGGSAPALFAAFEDAMWRRTFADDMTDVQYARFYRYAANERFAGLRAIIGDATSPWFDDRSTPGVRETRDDIARMAAVDAVALLRDRYGDPTKWRWDQIHAVKFAHALSGGGRLLDWMFSRGPVPVGGDNTTVNKTTTNLRRPYETSEAASYRQILDVGAWDASVGVNTTGQSGHPASPHYFDQNALWRQGGYHPLPFTRPAVEAATVSLLELVPTGNWKLETGN